MGITIYSKYKPFKATIKKLNNDSYIPITNEFYNDELVVNESGNVHIVNNIDDIFHERLSNDKLVTLINERR